MHGSKHSNAHVSADMTYRRIPRVSWEVRRIFGVETASVGDMNLTLPVERLVPEIIVIPPEEDIVAGIIAISPLMPTLLSI